MIDYEKIRAWVRGQAALPASGRELRHVDAFWTPHDPSFGKDRENRAAFMDLALAVAGAARALHPPMGCVIAIELEPGELGSSVPSSQREALRQAMNPPLVSVADPGERGRAWWPDVQRSVRVDPGKVIDSPVPEAEAEYFEHYAPEDGWDADYRRTIQIRFLAALPDEDVGRAT